MSVLLFPIPTWALEAPPRLGAWWTGTLPLGTTDAVLGDFLGDGAAQLAVAAGDRVHLYVWDEEAAQYTPHFSVAGFPAPVASLASADFTGDGNADLWIGTDGSGVIQIYSVQGQSLVLQASVGRLWGRVAEMIPVDLTQNGRPDLLARNTDGVAYIFLQDETGFHPWWRTPPGAPPDHHIAAADLTGDGHAEIVLGKGQGYVGVYRWVPPLAALPSVDEDGGPEGSASVPILPADLMLVAEHFPWGALHTLDIADVDGDGHPEIVVATDRQLMYAYGWHGGRHDLQTQWGFTDSSTGIESLYRSGGAPLLVGLVGDRAHVWHATEPEVQTVWTSPRATRALHRVGDGAFLLLEQTGQAALIGVVAGDYIRLVHAGRALQAQRPPLVEGDTVWLAAEDWQRILTLRAWFTRGGERLTGVAPGFQFFIVDADSRTAWVNGRQSDLGAQTRMVDGHLYIPTSFAVKLGYDAEWSAALRTLNLR